MGLVPDHVDVIEGHPLVPLVGVGPHAAGGVVDHLPALVVDLVADLVVGEEAPGPGELPGVPALGRGVQPVLGRLVQGEGLAVQRQSKNKSAIGNVMKTVMLSYWWSGQSGQLEVRDKDVADASNAWTPFYFCHKDTEKDKKYSY